VKARKARPKGGDRRSKGFKVTQKVTLENAAKVAESKRAPLVQHQAAEQPAKAESSYNAARDVPMQVTAGQIDDLVGWNNYGLDGHGPAAIALNALYHGAAELKLLREACHSDLFDGEEFSCVLYMLAIRFETAAEIAHKAMWRAKRDGES
jgi:hypothetical protein